MPQGFTCKAPNFDSSMLGLPNPELGMMLDRYASRYEDPEQQQST
jgi:hypothetical protein